MWKMMSRLLKRRSSEHEGGEARSSRLSGRLLQIHDEERRRLARELHDSTGQDLAALEMRLAQLDASVGDRLGEADRRVLSESLALVQRCARQVRGMSYLLHPPLLDELGLDVAVRDFVEGFSRRTEIPVSLDVSSDIGRLGLEIETALFRIVQECLVNVQRHSKSPSAAVRLQTDDGDIRLEVRDHGRGIERRILSEQGSTAHRGVGIRGMRERMHQLGGRLRVESGPGGTTVKAVLPTEAARRSH